MKTFFISGIKTMPQKNGFGLVSAIMVITVLTTLILIMARFIWTNSHRNAIEAENIKAFYLAESAIEYALQKSIDLDNWDWSQNGKYGDGDIDVSVSLGIEDAVEINARAELGVTAKSNSLFMNIENLLNYSIYITGEVNGKIKYDSEEHLRFNVLNIPQMNLDSLKDVAKNQGNYFLNSVTIDNHSDFQFWSNPYNHNDQATIIYTEKDLILSRKNKSIGAIFIIMGDLILDQSKGIEGVFFMANASSGSLLNCDGKKKHNLNGAIIGNTDIISPKNKLSVYYDRDIIEKFYSYSLTGSSIIDKIYWTANY